MTSVPFRPVLLDLSDPVDAALLIVALRNRELEVRREEQTDPMNRISFDDGWVRMSQELLEEADRLASLRADIERQLAEGES